MSNDSVYSKSGVNTSEGDDFSKFAGRVCQDSYQNSPFVEVMDFSAGHFRGPKGWRFTNLPPKHFIDGSADGVGTKVIVIDATKQHNLSAHDIFAMTGDDIVRGGLKPAIFFNILDVATLDKVGTATNNTFRQLILGMGEVAKQQQVVCYRGETAELGVCIGSEIAESPTRFNWAAVMIGIGLPDRVITGNTLAAGQVVVALRERGCRSNGISAVRRGLRSQFGEEYWNASKAQRWLKEAVTPSTVYSKFLADMNGWTYPVTAPRYKMHLIAHISGGGIADKFGKDLLFRYGLSADLTNLYEPPAVLKKTREWTDMSDREAYKVFSSGNGALIVLDGRDVEGFITMAEGYGLEARHAGRIKKSDEPHLRIVSGYTGQTLVYRPEE